MFVSDFVEMGLWLGVPMARNPADVASMIRSQTAELAVYARSANLGTLGFLLEMTLIEALRVENELTARPPDRRSRFKPPPPQRAALVQRSAEP